MSARDNNGGLFRAELPIPPAKVGPGCGRTGCERDERKPHRDGREWLGLSLAVAALPLLPLLPLLPGWPARPSSNTRSPI